ncbi:N utilization substance protein B [bacterium]|nr:MAG: N utilization substance protein B [bacterium]
MGYTFGKIIMEENITIHPRRKAREATMQALYALEINNGFPQDVLELCDDSFNNSENDIYTRELFNCVVEKQSWADDLISQCLENWEYGRVAILDKILLRMGVSEIYHIDDVPPKVSISEMVEIAKVYSTEESSSFVNGILDTIYKNYSEKN